jgi:hypothetical protein
MSKKVTKGNQKMGYSQDFGPARMNGYASGALKVGKIMSDGPDPIMKVAGPGDGILGTAKKVARTLTRGLGDIGMQAYDLVNPDVNKINYGSQPSSHTTSYGDAKKAKKIENKHYAKSRALAKSGKTYGSLANVFDDDGKGKSIKK